MEYPPGLPVVRGKAALYLTLCHWWSSRSLFRRCGSRLRRTRLAVGSTGGREAG
jgi:hypothetical protein